jgi:hypothetical protein
MNRITIHALDKDGNGCYTETFPITKNLKDDVESLESRVPFSRYYFDCEVDDEDNLTNDEWKWINEADLEL